MTLIAHADKVLTAYYFDILGGEAATTWNFDINDIYDNTERVVATPLLAPFSDGEARAAVHAMSPHSALGPNGIGPAFYNAPWATVNPAVMHFLNAFHDEQVDLQ